MVLRKIGESATTILVNGVEEYVNAAQSEDTSYDVDVGAGASIDPTPNPTYRYMSMENQSFANGDVYSIFGITQQDADGGETGGAGSGTTRNISGEWEFRGWVSMDSGASTDECQFEWIGDSTVMGDMIDNISSFGTTTQWRNVGNLRRFRFHSRSTFVGDVGWEMKPIQSASSNLTVNDVTES